MDGLMAGMLHGEPRPENSRLFLDLEDGGSLADGYMTLVSGQFRFQRNRAVSLRHRIFLWVRDRRLV
jgi:hypothetical protein